MSFCTAKIVKGSTSNFLYIKGFLTESLVFVHFLFGARAKMLCFLLAKNKDAAHGKAKVGTSKKQSHIPSAKQVLYTQ